MKRLLTAILCISISFVLAACWSYKEIDKLNLAAGLAIDKTSEDKYLVTIEIINIQQKGKESEVKSDILEVEGETVFDAIRNAISKVSNSVYWAHAKVVIISRKVAQEGVVKILDFLLRDPENRETMDILVSENETAREIFDAKALVEVIKSYEIDQMLIDEKNLSKTMPVQSYEFNKLLKGKGISPVLPSVRTEEINGEKLLKLSGMAIFNGDKFLGFLNEEDTKSFLFVIDKIKGGLLIINMGSEDEHEYIILEIFKNKSKIKPLYNENKLSIEIEIKTNVAIAEYAAKVDYTSEEGRLEIKTAAEKQLEDDIKNVVKKVQNDFGMDIFGFGNTVYRRLPFLWKEKENEWSTIFKNLEVTVNSEIEIENSGFLAKPIEMGD